MKIIQKRLVVEEKQIDKEIELTLLQEIKERAKSDKDFALLRKHEQLEIIYNELCFENGEEMSEDIIDWYIEC